MGPKNGQASASGRKKILLINRAKGFIGDTVNVFL